VKILVDAQLPRRLCFLLISKGYEAVHTLDLPKGNSTPDSELISFADLNNYIVVTKDNDFLDNFLLYGNPKKMIIVTTGNINNNALIRLFETNIDQMIELLLAHSVIEVSSTELVVHF